MHPKNELSDCIATLFYLDGKEFNPEIHRPMAEFIVDKLGRERTYFARIIDFFNFKDSDEEDEEESEESERVGQFVIRPLGRLDSSKYLGFHPKIQIVDWKSEVMKSPFQETEVLEIAYERKKVLGLHKFSWVENEEIQLGRFVVSSVDVSRQWIYRV